MKRLPLYPADKRVPLETAAATKTDPSCTRCDRRMYARSPCIPGHGNAVVGCVLVIGSAPGHTNDISGMSFVDDTGLWVRAEIQRVYNGPVFYTYAARCHGTAMPTNEEVEACQTYLASMVRALKPSKIITLGDAASQAVVGRRVVTPNKDALHIPAAYRPYAYLYETKTPVYFLRDAYALSTNRLFSQEFSAELDWALNGPLPGQPPWDEVFYEIETPEDAQHACDYLRGGGGVVYDTEYSGHMHTPFFQVDTLAAVRRGETTAFVWGAALGDEQCVAPLRAILEDPDVVKGGHNVSTDIRSAEIAPPSSESQQRDRVLHVRAQLMRSDAAVTLEDQAETVGMGGHKREMQAALAVAVDAVKAARNHAPMDTLTLRGVFLRPLAAAVAYPQVQEGAFTYGLVDAPLRNRYCCLDTVASSLLIANVMDVQMAMDDGARRTYQTFMFKVPRLIARMENRGVLADKQQILAVARYAEMKVAESTANLDRIHRGIDWSSPVQVSELFFGKLNLKNGGNTSVDADAIKAMKGKHPAVDAYAEYTSHKTIRDRYGVQLLRFISPDGMIRGRFNPIGTETGRWSCVPSWTKITTKRGEIPIVDVVVGDYVWTHKGRWRRVTHTWFKGVEEMVSVHFASGEVLTCTKSHRILCSDGRWITAGELENVSFNGLGGELRESGESFEVVQLPRVPHHGPDCGDAKDVITECGGPFAGVPTSRETCEVDEYAIRALKAGQEEPNAREVRGSAPQLEGGLRRRLRVPHQDLQRKEDVCAPHRNDGGAWYLKNTNRNGCAPYRWGREKQQCAQLGVSDHQGAPNNSCQGEGSKDSPYIYHAGRFGVYDITVDEDSSYLACRVFNHNSDRPNLQNLPSRHPVYGPMISNVFVARPGYVILKADYSQIEYRVAAYLSGDKVMQQVFIDGIDLHRRTAELISMDVWGIPTDVMKGYDKDQIKPYRSASKQVNFGTLYGLSDASLADDIGCTVLKASQLKSAIMGIFVDLAAWVKNQQRIVMYQGFTNNILFGEVGRRRYLTNAGSRDSGRVSSSQRQAVNSPAQGSSAEIVVDAMCELDESLDDYSVDAGIFSQVHDAIYVEVADRDLDVTARLMRAIMESRGLGPVPLVADFETGTALGSLREYKFT